MLKDNFDTVLVSFGCVHKTGLFKCRSLNRFHSGEFIRERTKCPTPFLWDELTFFHYISILYFKSFIFKLLTCIPNLRHHSFFQISGSVPIREKCPSAEFFLVRIFLYSDWKRRFTEKIPFSVRMQENIDQKKLCIWTLFTQCSCFRLVFLLNILWKHRKRTLG